MKNPEGNLPKYQLTVTAKTVILLKLLKKKERGFQKRKEFKEEKTVNGAVAQLGERLNGIQEVGGSIPLSSTILKKPGFNPGFLFV